MPAQYTGYTVPLVVEELEELLDELTVEELVEPPVLELDAWPEPLAPLLELAT
jgi:hypothetical protein